MKIRGLKVLFLLSILTIALLSTLFFSRMASATPDVIEVPNGGSIQAAIYKAEDGDTIIVEAGVYNECLLIDKSLRLIGESGAVIKGDGTRDTVKIAASGVAFVGFTVNGSSRSAWSGIYMKSVDNNITGNYILNHYYGIYIFDSSNITLKNNIMTNNQLNLWVWGLNLFHFLHDIDSSNKVNGKPVYYWLNRRGGQVPLDAGYVAIINSSNVVVNDLTLTGNGEGVLFAYTKNSIISNVSASGNLRGIRLLSSSDNLIVRSVINNNEWCGILVDTSSSNEIVKNAICGNEHFGIVLSYSPLLLSRSRDNIVSANNITDNSVGIDLAGAERNVIRWNRIDNDRRNVMFDSSCYNSLYGNSITNSERGVWLFRSSNNYIHHNVFIDNTIQVYIQDFISNCIWNGDYPSGGNYWSDYEGVDLRSGPYQNETGSDGIGDSRYIVDPSTIPLELRQVDVYPLMAPLYFFDVGTWNGESCAVYVISNCTVSNFKLDANESTISFNVNGSSYGLGFCRVVVQNVIVEEMWTSNFTVLVDGVPLLTIRNWTDSAYTYIYFAYEHLEHEVAIIPEFSSALILSLFMLLILISIAFSTIIQNKK